MHHSTTIVSNVPAPKHMRVMWRSRGNTRGLFLRLKKNKFRCGKSSSNQEASSWGPSTAEYQDLVGSLRDIVKKDTQLLDDRTKLLDTLTKLIERNEILVQEHNQMRKKYKDDQKVQSDIMAALEKENGLLRQRVKDQEKEIIGLVKEIAGIKNEISTRTDVDVNGAGRSVDIRAKMTEQEKKKIDEDFFVAVFEGRRDEVQVLLANGANVDAADCGRIMTPLIVASGNGKLKIVEVLLANGANIDAADGSGRTALMWAASWGHNDVLETLIHRGANLDMRDISGETAFMKAKGFGQERCAETIRAAGAYC